MTTTNRTGDRDPFERELAALLAADAQSAGAGAEPPSAARVWWRAQTRAHREALDAVNRPLTVVHAVGIACGAGLLLALATVAVTWLGKPGGWTSRADDAFASAAALLSADLSGRWLTLSLTAMLVSVVVLSVAAYVVFADE
ncbi:MAG TPA: hypothetical protein VFX12_10800 [Vicinamibacterales bacterium]|nr:hypothetical protein [Vicinamibacterales bacterium]